MYPLRYYSGEVIRVGDVISWFDPEGNAHNGTIGRLAYHLKKTDKKNDISHQWRLDESFEELPEGDVVVVGSSPETSHPPKSLVIKRLQRTEIPWDKIALIKRGDALAYYVTGEPVHQGDYVATTTCNGQMTLYRILVIQPKYKQNNENNIEIYFIDSQGKLATSISYYDENGSMSWSWSWEEVFFVTRGKWPDDTLMQYYDME